MVSVLAQERLLGAALGSILTGIVVFEQRRTIYRSISQSDTHSHCIPEDHDEANVSFPTLLYYILPCFFLFDRSHKLLNLVLKTMGSLITASSSSLCSPNCIQYAMECSSRINAIVSVLVFMHKDVKVQKIISAFKAEIVHMLQKILSLQSSEEISMSNEERHKIQRAFHRLKVLISKSSNGIPAI